MNWDAIGAVGEVAGALLVAFTLIYLIIQVRQNSASIDATTTQSNIAGFNQLNMMLATNPKLAEILDRGSESPSELSEEENLSYTWIIRSYLNLYLNLYDQYRDGTCPKYLWNRHAKELKVRADSPGLRAFLEIDTSYQEMFDYIEEMPETLEQKTEFRLSVRGGRENGAQ